VTWDSSHFFRAPDGSTYMPFTVTVDKSKVASPTAALYVARGQQGRRSRARRRREQQGQERWSSSRLREVRFRDVGADGKAGALHSGEAGRLRLYVAIKDKGTVEKVDKNYTPRSAS
jgi:hypothetical protein